MKGTPQGAVCVEPGDQFDLLHATRPVYVTAQDATRNEVSFRFDPNRPTELGLPNGSALGLPNGWSTMLEASATFLAQGADGQPVALSILGFQVTEQIGDGEMQVGAYPKENWENLRNENAVTEVTVRLEDGTEMAGRLWRAKGAKADLRAVRSGSEVRIWDDLKRVHILRDGKATVGQRDGSTIEVDLRDADYRQDPKIGLGFTLAGYPGNWMATPVRVLEIDRSREIDPRAQIFDVAKGKVTGSPAPSPRRVARTRVFDEPGASTTKTLRQLLHEDPTGISLHGTHGEQLNVRYRNGQYEVRTFSTSTAEGQDARRTLPSDHRLLDKPLTIGDGYSFSMHGHNYRFQLARLGRAHGRQSPRWGADGRAEVAYPAATGSGAWRLAERRAAGTMPKSIASWLAAHPGGEVKVVTDRSEIVVSAGAHGRLQVQHALRADGSTPRHFTGDRGPLFEGRLSIGKSITADIGDQERKIVPMSVDFVAPGIRSEEELPWDCGRVDRQVREPSAPPKDPRPPQLGPRAPDVAGLPGGRGANGRGGDRTASLSG